MDEKYIAIKYEKIYITDDLFAFKPVGLIRGTYDKQINLFESNYGELCTSITYCDSGETNFFGFPIEVEMIKEQYPDLTEFYLFNKYFTEKTKEFCIGYDDYKSGKANIISFTYNDVSTIFQSFAEKLDFFLLEETKEEQESKEKIEIKKETPKEEYDEVDLDNDDEYNLNSVKNEKSKELLKIALDKTQKKPLTLVELRKEVKSVIIGQDKAVDDVTRTIMINEKSKNPKNKSHMMIIGPSGTGKTEMINIIAKKLDIPFFKADATTYTKEGYRGKSVYSMFRGLIDAAGGDIKKAQRGLLIIDEIDKKSIMKDDDGFDASVLNGMLKFLDRDVIEINKGHGPHDDDILFDTSNLTVIFMGAFTDAYESKRKENKKSIGFAPIENNEDDMEEIYLTREDLIKAGMPVEFMGRIPLITSTRALELEDLVEILYKSKGNALKLAEEFCEDLGITLKYTEGYIKKIAEKSYKAKTGARNLKTDINESLKDAYDDILINEGKIKTLKLTKKTAENSKEYCAG